MRTRPADAPRSARGAAWAVTLALAGALGVLGAPREAAAEVRWCHRVRMGESLASLAARYKIGLEALAALNGLRPDTRVASGRLLLLPTVRALRRGRLRLASPSLRATSAQLRRENRAADRFRLSRMRNAAMVRRFVRAGLLVPIPGETATFYVEGVPAPLRVARPWTRAFLEHLGGAVNALFGARLKITSLTRTEGAQRALARWNGNAAPAVGPRRSSHLTGASVDISTRPHGAGEVRWFRTVLDRLTRAGVILAIEEIAQPHFHVMVLPAYARYARGLRTPLAVGGC